jgi:hypothetical protein
MLPEPVITPELEVSPLWFSTTGMVFHVRVFEQDSLHGAEWIRRNGESISGRTLDCLVISRSARPTICQFLDGLSHVLFIFVLGNRNPVRTMLARASNTCPHHACGRHFPITGSSAAL